MQSKFDIDTLIDFVENGKKIKDKHIKNNNDAKERVHFALAQMQGLLATKSLQGYSNSTKFIGKMRDYLETLIEDKSLDPKALGMIMKAELDNQTKLIELFLQGNKNQEETPLQQITNIQINHKNEQEMSGEEIKEVTKNDLQLIHQIKLFEDHLKDRIIEEEQKVIEVKQDDTKE